MSYHTNASSAISLCYQLQTFKNALRFIKEKTIFALAVGLFAFNANAAIIIRIQPSASGTEVIATASGSHTIQTPKDVGQTFNNPAWIIPTAGIVNFVSAVSAPGPILARITVPDMTCTGTMGSGGINAANDVSVTGDEFGFTGGNLLVPPLKTVGDVVYTTGTMTFTGTLASLGFTAGTRSCTWGSGTQSLTITVLTSPAPTVTSLSPNNGPAAGGTSVTITGTDLTGATAVTIGGVAATNVTVVNSTTITATTPAHASGAASVVVTTPGGNNASNSLYTYAPLLTQTGFTVAASPNVLNATTTTSTLSTSGGSGTGAVSYAMTAGSCTLSGSTVTAGTASETCTVTATKAADSAYAASTATVNITVARRASIAAAATDASVLAIHGAQIMQSQKFVTTQIENVANHLSAYRNNLNLRSSQFGFGVNLPSMGPASQALYKIKDELTPRATSQTQSKVEKTGFNKVGFIQDQAPKFSSDYTNQDSLTAEVAHEDQKQVQAQIDKSQADAANSYFERESLTYSFWTAGTIDFGNYKTGDNKETQNRLTANGLTMGLDYKLHDSAIVGGAIGFGTAWHNAAAINTNLKAKQSALTGYGMFGFADNWSVEGLVGYGMLDFTGNRTTSDGAAQLGVNRQGDAIFSSGTVSKMYWMQGYRVSPFVRQDVMRINLNNYAETGAVDYALGFDDTNFMHTTTSAGLQVSRDIFLEGAKLMPTAKIALNRIRTGGLVQNIYYADTGPAGDVYTMNQSGSYMTTQSLSLGLMYITRAGDGFDLAWQGALGANQYKLNGLRFAVRFAM